LLKPLVVTAHLLGGMSTLALLLWLRLRLDFISAPQPVRVMESPGLRLLGLAALAAVALQIGLGGWVSSNYAALACPDFPSCRDGQWLPVDTPTAIHLAHRGGALVVTLTVGAFVAALWRRQHTASALLVAAALTLQLCLGIANVLLQLPLLLAVAHNSGAALLLATLLFANAQNQRLFWSIKPTRPAERGQRQARAAPTGALGKHLAR
jgi:cytochrome c oxidase assembly protein subunit 15